MNRRHFILTSAAFALAGAAPFRPARFSVVTRGTGPDVLMIPGLTAGREIWRATAEALPGFRFHLLQVAGFAGEPARGNRSGPLLAPLAAEIARYIAEAGLVRPALVGHSMGGTLGMMIAARQPARLGRLMVVDMLPEPAALLGGSAAGWAPLSRLAGTAGGRRLLTSLFAAFSPPGSSNRNSDPDVVGRATQELIAADLTPLLPRIRAPLTVVYAVADRGLRAAIDRKFANAYAPVPGARLVRVDDSGHMVMLDQPARFREALGEFLVR